MQTFDPLLIPEFIEEIWNKRNFKRLDDFVHPRFTDHSLPPALSPDKEGMKQWILATGSSFEHRTLIEEQVSEGEKTILKIRMELKHTGPWRGIDATGIPLSTTGYRFFKISDGKIIAHWALIDGQAIENQLQNWSHGCRIGA